MVPNDEEWAALNLARVLEDSEHRLTADGQEWQDEAKRLDLPIIEVLAPGAAPALYIPELFYPMCEPRGVIVLNLACSSRQRAAAIRHEIGHHYLWPIIPNKIFGRRFPLDPQTEAYMLRERIVRRAEQICFRRS